MESNTTYFYNALNSTLRNIRIAKEFHHTKGHYEVRLRCTIAICVVNFLLCFTALFGNSAIILTIWKKSSLHCAANILLTSLAVSDFAVGLISHPLFIANLLMRIRYFSIPPRLLWVSFNVLTTFLSSVSFLTVTAIGMDRLLALQLHLRYRTVVTHFRVRCVIIFIWTYSGALSSVGSMEFGCVLQSCFSCYCGISCWEFLYLFENLSGCAPSPKTNSAAITTTE